MSNRHLHCAPSQSYLPSRPSLATYSSHPTQPPPFTLPSAYRLHGNILRTRLWNEVSVERAFSPLSTCTWHVPAWTQIQTQTTRPYQTSRVYACPSPLFLFLNLRDIPFHHSTVTHLLRGPLCSCKHMEEDKPSLLLLLLVLRIFLVLWIAFRARVLSVLLYRGYNLLHLRHLAPDATHILLWSFFVIKTSLKPLVPILCLLPRHCAPHILRLICLYRHQLKYFTNFVTAGHMCRASRHLA